MPFSEEDKVIIKHYRIDKGYGARRLLTEFPDKPWTKSGLEYLLAKIDETGSVERAEGSGRPRSVRTPENVALVLERCTSFPENPGSHCTPRRLAKEAGISRSSVSRILHQDLGLKTFRRMHGQKLTAENRTRRAACATRLLRTFTKEKLDRTFFTDEKIFTVDPPFNSQNDRLSSSEKDIVRNQPGKRRKTHVHFVFFSFVSH